MQAEHITPAEAPADDAALLTSYELLQLHPAAPLDLITAAYWRLAGEVQSQRDEDQGAQARLHQLTRAYQTLSRPHLRSEYDSSIGVGEQPMAPSVAQVRGGARGGLFGRAGREPQPAPHIDYYEILRVAPNANQQIVLEAYSTLRHYYFRLVQNEYAGPELLDRLVEAYKVLSDPGRRAKYDEERTKAALPGSVDKSVPAPAPKAEVAPPKPKRQAKPKVQAKTKSSAAPRVVVKPSARTIPRDESHSPLAAVSALAGAMGRQISNMSRRELEQSSGRLSGREHQVIDGSETEALLLERISSSVEVPAAGDTTGAEAVATLTVTDGPGSGATFEIPGFPVSIGGGDECDITLPGLAPQQARILYRDGRYVVYNLVTPDDEDADDFAPWWILESGDEVVLRPYRLRLTRLSG